MRESSRRQWGQIGRFYLWVVLATALPSIALSLFLWTPRYAAAWLQAAVSLPLITAGVLLVWSVTVYPLLLLLAVIFGRGSNPTGSDPNGAGIVICPFSVAGPHEIQPNKPVQPTRAASLIGTVRSRALRSARLNARPRG